MTYEVTIGDQTFSVELLASGEGAGGWRCLVNGRELKIDAVMPQPDALSLLVGGESFEIKREHAAGAEYIMLNGLGYAAEVSDPRAYRGRKRSAIAGDGPQKIVAPMPGKVIRVLLPEGAAVAAGQGVIVVEAMKMQNELKSPKAGVISKVLACEGTAVNAGDALVIVQ